MVAGVRHAVVALNAAGEPEYCYVSVHTGRGTCPYSVAHSAACKHVFAVLAGGAIAQGLLPTDRADAAYELWDLVCARTCRVPPGAGDPLPHTPDPMGTAHEMPSSDHEMPLELVDRDCQMLAPDTDSLSELEESLSGSTPSGPPAKRAAVGRGLSLGLRWSRAQSRAAAGRTETK
jgi:hypothetical protein